jgi:hypothetical protein
MAFPWGTPTQFEQKILSGTKIHTIREDRGYRWRPGMKIHLSTGIRTKHYRCFHETECVSIQPITIKHGPGDQVSVFISGLKFYHQMGALILNFDGMEQLAKNDGFEGVNDFFRWFDKDFQGRIIHWTDLKY